MSQAYALVNSGTAAQGTTVTPSAPASVVAGRLLLMPAFSRSNADTWGAVTNWTLLTSPVNATWGALYARIATATAGDNPPTLGSGANQLWSQISQWSGDVWQGGLGSIVDNQIDANGTSVSVPYSALTPSGNDRLVIAMAEHNKTATGDGQAFNALSGFAQVGQIIGTGNRAAGYWGYVQQTAAAAIGAATQTMSAPTESLQYGSFVIALKTEPAAGGGGGAIGAIASYLSRRRI